MDAFASAYGHEYDHEYDVVVVGSGGAGMAAAYFASQSGFRTLVIEGTDVIGGTTAYSGGGLWLPAAAPLARAGIEDSTELARDYLAAVIGPDDEEPSRSRREAFLTTAPEAMASLEASEWLPFKHQAFPDYFDRPGRQPQGRSQHPEDVLADDLGNLSDGRRIEELVRSGIDDDRHQTGKRRRTMQGGRALIGRLAKAFDESGRGTIRTNTRLVSLIRDCAMEATDDTIVGLEVQTPQGTERIGARHAVILASGGIEGSADLRREVGVPGRVEWSLAPRGANNGDGQIAAADAGADLDLMEEAWWCPGISVADGGATFTVGFRSGFFVDQAGTRFGNEFLPYDQQGRQLKADPNRVPAWFIFDSREGGGLPAIALPTPDPSDCLAQGIWLQADTLEELAELTGLPTEALVATARRYNELAELGDDHDCGRGDDVYEKFFLFGPNAGRNPALPLLDNPPYYAAPLVLGDMGTKGGIRTDTYARALRPDGSVITGLFAVGNTAAAWSKNTYPGPGVPIGTGVVFARRAVAKLNADLVQGSELTP